VSHKDFFEQTRRVVKRYFPFESRIRVIVGGKHRIHSYFKAVEFIVASKLETPITVVHDAARPLIEMADVEQLYKAFISKKADVLVVRRALPESLYKYKEGLVGALVCVPRDQYTLGQSPNIFKTALLQRINTIYNRPGTVFPATCDIVELIPRKNTKIVGVPVEHPNTKITHHSDLCLVESLLKKSRT
jgi:2-C-methyl-D-erythritol 4-phosphate cytidylyltransferase